MNRYVILGASRGLGSELAQQITDGSLLLVSRNLEHLKLVNDKVKVKCDYSSFDLANLKDSEKLESLLKEYNPTHIYYVAGGGPYGKFEAKDFKDHLWAYKLNLLFPAKLVHWSLNNLNLEQFILVGSSVAESSADPLASSYSSAKHGLKGLVSSINLEGCKIDLRLFSPPYMDTDLLPNNSLPYTEGKVRSPSEIAQLFYKWANDANGLKHYFIEVE